MAKTVIGVYENVEAAEAAVEDLLQNDFGRNDISVVAKDTREDIRVDFESDDPGEGAAAGAGFGAVLGGAAGLLAGLGALTIPGIGPIVAAGPIAATLAGAGVGAAAGGITGALVDWGVPSEDAHVYSEGIRHGGILVSVRTTDNRAQRAADILENNNPVDLTRQAQAWREEEGGTIEIIEEEPVVGTSARAVRKEARERVETVAGDVRRTGVRVQDIDEHRDLDDPGEVRYLEYEGEWQNHWRNNYARTGRDFDDYRGAYVYGCRLYDSDVGDWRTAEPEARRYWNENYPNRRWEDYRDAVRQGFMVCERL